MGPRFSPPSKTTGFPLIHSQYLLSAPIRAITEVGTFGRFTSLRKLSQVFGCSRVVPELIHLAFHSTFCSELFAVARYPHNDNSRPITMDNTFRFMAIYRYELNLCYKSGCSSDSKFSTSSGVSFRTFLATSCFWGFCSTVNSTLSPTERSLNSPTTS